MNQFIGKCIFFFEFLFYFSIWVGLTQIMGKLDRETENVIMPPSHSLFFLSTTHTLLRSRAEHTFPLRLGGYSFQEFVGYYLMVKIGQTVCLYELMWCDFGRSYLGFNKHISKNSETIFFYLFYLFIYFVNEAGCIFAISPFFALLALLTKSRFTENHKNSGTIACVLVF